MIAVQKQGAGQVRGKELVGGALIGGVICAREERRGDVLGGPTPTAAGGDELGSGRGTLPAGERGGGGVGDQPSLGGGLGHPTAGDLTRGVDLAAVLVEGADHLEAAAVEQQ